MRGVFITFVCDIRTWVFFLSSPLRVYFNGDWWYFIKQIAQFIIVFYIILMLCFIFLYDIFPRVRTYIYLYILYQKTSSSIYRYYLICFCFFLNRYTIIIIFIVIYIIYDHLFSILTARHSITEHKSRSELTIFCNKYINSRNN